MAAFDLALSCVRNGTDDLLLPRHINPLALTSNQVFRNTTLTPGNERGCPALIVNPFRPGRLEPRALQGGKHRFPYMTSPRTELKSQLRAKYKDMS